MLHGRRKLLLPFAADLIVHDQNEILFKDRANDHKDDLQEEADDAVLQLLARFL